MTAMRNTHTPQLKAKVALEAIKGIKTTAEISAKYGVHSTQVTSWKKKAMEILPEAFSVNRKRADIDQAKLVEALYKQIGQLTMEVDWLKKNLNCSDNDKRQPIDSQDPNLSVRRQCKLLGINRSSLYCTSRGESEYNRLLMNALDEQYTKMNRPGFFGGSLV